MKLITLVLGLAALIIACLLFAFIIGLLWKGVQKVWDRWPFG